MISAIVVSHGHAAELETSLPALEPQVDEIVLIGNIPGSLPPGRTGIENPAAALVRREPEPRDRRGDGRARSSSTTPTPCRSPEPLPRSRRSWRSIPRAGIVGPRLVNPDGTEQHSRRAFPTVGGTIVRRTPLRRAFPPQERQRAHYNLDEHPTEPVEADWMLGGSLLLRREMLDELGGYDAGFRMYGEEIDLCYRAAKAGWERWYVPGAVVTHRWDALTDKRFLTRRTLWHWRSILRYARKHPETIVGR